MIRRCFYAHPLTAVRFIRRFLPLLLIPLLRSVYMLVVYGDIAFSIWDVSVTAAVIAIGLARCRNFAVTIYEDSLLVQNGLVFKSTAVISLDKISGVFKERSPISAVLGAVSIRIETEAGNTRKADVDIFMSASDADALIRSTLGYKGDDDRQRSTARQTVLMSLSNASALSGLLIWSTVINYSGKLLGRRLERAVLDTLTDTAARIGRLIPPAATVIAAIAAVGFGISFVLILIKHATFYVGTSEHIIHIRQGIIWRKESFIRSTAINAVTFSQPPIMRILRRGSLLLSVAGHGKFGNESEAVIPTLAAASSMQMSKKLGVFDVPELELKKPKRVRRRAIVLPLWLAATSLLPFVLSAIWMRDATVIAVILSVVGVTAALYRMNVRLAGLQNGGLHLGRVVRVKDAERMTVKDTCIDLDRIDSITLRQNPFDRRWRVCSVRVSARGEKGLSVVARDIDKHSAEQQIKRTFYR